MVLRRDQSPVRGSSVNVKRKDCLKRKKQSWRVRQDDCYARAAHLRATLSSLSLSLADCLPLPNGGRMLAIFDESRGHRLTDVVLFHDVQLATNFVRSRANEKRQKHFFLLIFTLSSLVDATTTTIFFFSFLIESRSPVKLTILKFASSCEASMIVVV